MQRGKKPAQLFDDNMYTPYHVAVLRYLLTCFYFAWSIYQFSCKILLHNLAVWQNLSNFSTVQYHITGPYLFSLHVCIYTLLELHSKSIKFFKTIIHINKIFFAYCAFTAASKITINVRMKKITGQIPVI